MDHIDEKLSLNSMPAWNHTDVKQIEYSLLVWLTTRMNCTKEMRKA